MSKLLFSTSSRFFSCVMTIAVFSFLLLMGCEVGNPFDSDDGDNSNGGSNNTGGAWKNDGYVYTGRTAKIGNLTWTAENLNRKTDNSWCYDNNSSNCTKYGRLYTWHDAMEVCPSGWRLPTLDDWDDLIVAVSGRSLSAGGTQDVARSRLKSTSGWDDNNNGTDDFGFSALPGGLRSYYFGNFGNAGTSAYWWSASTGMGAAGRHMSITQSGMFSDAQGMDHGFSVRCVQE